MIFRSAFLFAYPLIALGCLLSSVSSTVHADIVQFKLTGNGGDGILSSNENPQTGGGSGGIRTGISFDTDTNELSIDVGWGAGNGFTDLTSAVTLLNIHGPTADEAPTSFSQNAAGLMSLGGVDTSPTDGGFIGTVTINAGNVDDLFTGRLYLHIHTEDNSGGEARGYFVPVPEPGSTILVVAGLGFFVGTRRRRKP